MILVFQVLEIWKNVSEKVKIILTFQVSKIQKKFVSTSQYNSGFSSIQILKNVRLKKSEYQLNGLVYVKCASLKSTFYLIYFLINLEFGPAKKVL